MLARVVALACLLGCDVEGAIHQRCATTDENANFVARIAPQTEVCACGASLPNALYQLATSAYATYGQVSYTATGSTTGKASAEHYTVDFAGSDSLLKSGQYHSAPDLQVGEALAAFAGDREKSLLPASGPDPDARAILTRRVGAAYEPPAVHTRCLAQMYPATAAAVVPVYNVPELANAGKVMVLSRSVLPKIFLGDIYLWDDAAIIKEQDDAEVISILQNLTTKEIKVVVRDDGSGTTEIFTKALSHFSADFKTRMDGGNDVLDWCEDGMESMNCPTTLNGTDNVAPTDDDSDLYYDSKGTCINNQNKSNCLGGKNECEGISWELNSGFQTSGLVTCAKGRHTGRHWSYTRGYKNAGVVAGVFAQGGAIGYAVLSDAIANNLAIAKMKNKAEQTVTAGPESVSFALMELGGLLDERGNADLMDASSTFAWPIAGYTYFVLRKGWYDGTNYMGQAAVMFDCTTRYNTLAYMEWYYTAETVAAMGHALGFTMLPSFIADSVVVDMLGENYCDASSPKLAKKETRAAAGNLYIAGLAKSILDTYVAVYREVDQAIVWQYNVVPDTELQVSMLDATSSTVYSASEIDAGIGITSFSADKVDTIPADIVAAPLFIAGVVPQYHVGNFDNIALTIDQIADVLLGKIWSWDQIRADLPRANISVVARIDACDTTEIVTATLSKYNTDFAKVIGTTRQLRPEDYPSFAPTLIKVESENQVQAAVTFHDNSIGMWVSLGKKAANIARVVQPASDATLTLNTDSLSACEEGGSFTFTSAMASITSTVYDASLSTSINCWPFARAYAMVIKEDKVGSAQCEHTDFHAGSGESTAIRFAKWMLATSKEAITSLGAAPASDSDLAHALSQRFSFDCNPDTSVCGAGTYYTTDGACVACAEGYIAPSEGQTACIPCDKGAYESHRKLCLPCDSHSYQDEEGKASCKSCVDNSQYIVASGDSSFPFVPKTGAANKTDCACITGYYAPKDTEQGDECLPCPIGAVCIGNGADDRILPLPQVGYWASEGNSEVMFKCTSTFACPGGEIGKCGPGFVGKVCSRCQEGFFMRNGECLECGDGNRAAAGIALAAFLIIATGVHIVSNTDKTSPLKRSSIAVGAVTNATILFLQLFNLFLTIRVEWPREVEGIMTAVAFVNIDLSVLSPECAYNISFVDSFKLKCVLPLYFVAYYVVFAIAHIVYIFTCSHRKSHMEEKKERCTQAVCMAFNATLVMVSILYISTATTILQAFACTEQPDGSRTMPTYPSLDCDSDEFKAEVFPVALFTLIAIIVGFPTTLLMLFRWAYNSTDPGIRICTAGVSLPYKKKYYMWDVVDNARKLTIAVVLTFGAAVSSGKQIAITTMLILGALVMQVTYRPFKHRSVNALNMYLFIILLLVLISAGMVYNEGNDVRESGVIITVTLSVLIITAVISAILFAGMVACYSLAVLLHSMRTKRIVHHKVIVNPQLLLHTLNILRDVPSDNLIEHAKQLLDDEDMQFNFNETVILLLVLGVTSKDFTLTESGRQFQGQLSSAGLTHTEIERLVHRFGMRSRMKRATRLAEEMQDGLPIESIATPHTAGFNSNHSRRSRLSPEASCIGYAESKRDPKAKDMSIHPEDDTSQVAALGSRSVLETSSPTPVHCRDTSETVDDSEDDRGKDTEHETADQEPSEAPRKTESAPTVS